ncbi:MAG: hypothetical protein O3B02_03300 [Proteobacteria bacterium]|nr:hypothetical protein [Pseudomonadales bacterium]MBL6804554.1 hypothetical protein [Pseudomonadales bacterium]MDA0805383.1 hypothetical protein [Pseudomonadota bacterium]MDA0895856.1 hypothetical protein [Pseudomonadota bacterium]MDA1244013.1 hypothetical protein [Pseudomonadota bacterium]
MDSPIGSCAGIANFGLIYEVVYRRVYELIRGILRGQGTIHSALKQPLIMPLLPLQVKLDDHLRQRIAKMVRTALDEYKD